MAVRIEDDDTVEVAMAPLIDCVFLLLIFFLVATTMKKIEKELPVELPTSGAAVTAEVTDSLVVVGIDRNGSFYLGSEPVGIEALHAKMREAAATNPNGRIRIDGDRDAPFQSLVHLLDLCEFEGLGNVGIHARREEK